MTDQPTTAGRLVLPDTESQFGSGVEWIVDAHGCDRHTLCKLDQIIEVCEQVIADLGLKVVGDPQAHQFPDPGGVTTLYLLSESHLACHTYPERSLATFNLYCCRARPPWDWQQQLAAMLSATRVEVQRIERGQR